MLRRRLAALGGVTVGLFAAVPGALADQQISAGFHDRFVNGSVTIAQGEHVTFSNSDTDRHNVAARDNGSDGQPLFASKTIGGTDPAVAVEGTQYLKTGSYRFYCTLHEQLMNGTLTVTSEGTPATPPGSGSNPGSGGSTGAKPGGSSSQPGNSPAKKQKNRRRKGRCAKRHGKGKKRCASRRRKAR